MQKTISIIVPIYSDEKTIGNTIEQLILFYKIQHLTGEIIVVNDGGKDRGVEIVKEKMKQHSAVKLIERAINRGKGYSVREGLAAAQEEYIFYTDADLPYGTNPILHILEMLNQKKADMVLVNRETSTVDYYKHTSIPRHITHIIFSLFVRTLIPIRFHDTLAGLKGMRREVVRTILSKLSIDRFSFDVELILAAQKAGFFVKDIPVTLENAGVSNLTIARDAPQMAKDIIKIFMRNVLGKYNATRAKK